MNKDSSKLLKTSIIYAIGQIVTQVMNFFLIPIYTNKLGKIEYGKIAIINTFTGFVSSFLILSIYSGMCRFYKESEDKNEIVSTALNFSYIIGGIVVLISLLFGKPIANLVFKFDNNYRIFLLVIFTSLLGQISSIYTSKYLMEYKALKVTAVEVIRLIIQFSTIIHFVIFKETGIIGIFYGQFIATLLIFIYFTITEIKNYKFIISNKMLKNMLVYSVGLLPVGVSGWILTLADRYFIDYYNGYGQTGIYHLGYQFGMLINPIFITPFLNSFTPYKFEIYKDDDAKERFKRLFRKYSVIGCFIILGLSIFSKFGILIISNKDFISAYKVVPLVAYSYFLYGKTGYYVLGLQIKNKTYKEGIYMVISAFLNVALNFLFVPKMGMIGAAITTIISYFFLNFMFIIVSQKEYKIDLDIKYQFSIQFITFMLCLLYYFISVKNIKMMYEFIISVIIIFLYFIILIGFKFVSKKELKEELLIIFKRKKNFE